MRTGNIAKIQKAGNGGILTKYMDKRDRPEILWKEEAAVFWQTKAVV